MCRAVKHLPPPAPHREIPRRSPSDTGGAMASPLLQTRWLSADKQNTPPPLLRKAWEGSGMGEWAWMVPIAEGFFKIKKKKEKIKKQKKEEKKNTRLLIRQSQVRSQFELYWSLASSGRPSVSSPRPARRRNQRQDTNFSPSRPVTEHQG